MPSVIEICISGVSSENKDVSFVTPISGTVIIMKFLGEITIDQQTNLVLVAWKLSNIQMDYLLNLSSLLLLQHCEILEGLI